jgi:C-terminal peptidase prc
MMIRELGDDHSRYDSPTQVKEDDAQFSGNNDYVGIGVIHSGVPDQGYSVIILTFPDSPARAAGLKPHDRILSADGESVIDENGVLKSNIRGPEGTDLVLKVQTPGEEPRELTITRRRITGAVPIDYCLIPEPRIGYIFIPSFADNTIPGQIYDALMQMNADGKLQGLVLDNRQNLGGSIGSMETTLGYFTDGHQGDFVTRNDKEPVEITAEDVAGSQTVPLVVLVDLDSASAGEIFSGILQNSGRAQIVGQVTPGNVEELYGYDFDDGSRAWIASATFKPLGLPAGTWERTGIVPDVLAPTRWDLFNEATDPAFAAAVELLIK